MTSYFNACDVTVAYSTTKIFDSFLTCTCAPPLWKAPRDPWMIAIPFVSFSFWNRFYYDCKCYVYRLRKESSHCLLASSDSLYLLFKLTIWTLRYQRKRTNSTISFDEQCFPTSLCHIEKQQFYWNWSTLLFQISSLQSPKFNINKPTQRLASVGQLLLTNGLFPKTVAASGPLPTKWCRL